MGFCNLVCETDMARGAHHESLTKKKPALSLSRAGRVGDTRKKIWAGTLPCDRCSRQSRHPAMLQRNPNIPDACRMGIARKVHVHADREAVLPSLPRAYRSYTAFPPCCLQLFLLVFFPRRIHGPSNVEINSQINLC